jgi:hypothetical protein
MENFFKSFGRIFWFFIKLAFWYGLFFVLVGLDGQIQCISAPCASTSLFNHKLYRAVDQHVIWVYFIPLVIFLSIEYFISRAKKAAKAKKAI